MNHKAFDRDWGAIQNDDSLTQDEKNSAFRDLERDYGEAEQQLIYEEELTDLDRRYGR